jgi:hypothetical protein
MHVRRYACMCSCCNSQSHSAQLCTMKLMLSYAYACAARARVYHVQTYIDPMLKSAVRYIKTLCGHIRLYISYAHECTNTNILYNKLCFGVWVCVCVCVSRKRARGGCVGFKHGTSSGIYVCIYAHTHKHMQTYPTTTCHACPTSGGASNLHP